jgi:hypothetical protein
MLHIEPLLVDAFGQYDGAIMRREPLCTVQNRDIWFRLLVVTALAARRQYLFPGFLRLVTKETPSCMGLPLR